MCSTLSTLLSLTANEVSGVEFPSAVRTSRLRFASALAASTVKEFNVVKFAAPVRADPVGSLGSPVTRFQVRVTDRFPATPIVLSTY